MSIEQGIALAVIVVTFVAILAIPEWWRRRKERKGRRATSSPTNRA